jgi:hypothetical protein
MEKPTLAVGQVWKPKRGNARRIIPTGGDLPGVAYLVLPRCKTRGRCSWFDFQAWIERHGASLIT